jgi:polyhydroxyalkanoate synthesis regulator phasin
MATTRKSTSNRKSTRSARSSSRASSNNPAFQNAIDATEILRKRFEKRLAEVRTRFSSFEKDWSKTVDTLVTRGRSTEKDLRKRLEKVTRDLNKSPLLKAVQNADFVERVQNIDYDKVVGQLRKDVKGVQEEVVDFFQTSASRLKNVIDLPSRSDFERLNKKIDGLTSQVKSLEQKKRRA